MEVVLLLFVSISFGAVSSLTVLGAGFFLMPIITNVLFVSSSVSAALCEAFTALTTLPSILVEQRYGNIQANAAWNSIALSLPGTFVGTAISTAKFTLQLAWLFTWIAIVVLAAAFFSFVKSGAFHPQLKSLLRTDAAESLLHAAIGLVSAATGVSAAFFYVTWYRKRLKLPMPKALATAQFTAILISIFSLAEHLGSLLQATPIEDLVLAAGFASAWYGARIAHFYSARKLTVFYLSACMLTSLFLMAGQFSWMLHLLQR